MDHINSEEKYVKETYEEIASSFDGKRTQQWDWVEEFLEPYSDAIVYDIGCGGGRNLRNKFIGVDSCSNFIDICHKKGLNAILSDMTVLPFENNSVDAIISIASFHHLATCDRRIKALNELKRVLKPGGKILLSVWAKDQPEKTKRKFEYGDNIVPWNKNNVIHMRYYYIFKLKEIRQCFEAVGLTELSHQWICGNEVFILF